MFIFYHEHSAVGAKFVGELLKPSEVCCPWCWGRFKAETRVSRMCLFRSEARLNGADAFTSNAVLCLSTLSLFGDGIQFDFNLC